MHSLVLSCCPFLRSFLYLTFPLLKFLMAQCVKNLPARQETQETLVWSLSQGDPLEKEMAIHSSILGDNSMERGAWETTVHGVPKNLTRLTAYALGPPFSSVAQSCPTLCDPMNRSTPGLPVHHQLLEFTQTHVHWVGDAIQPSHPLLFPAPPAFSLSQHQGLFQWVRTLL